MTTDTNQATSEPENPGSPASGFLAVNRQTLTNGNTINGKPQLVAAPIAVRTELEILFTNIREGNVEGSPPAVARPHLNSKTKPKAVLSDDLGMSNASPVAIPNTPHNLVNHQRPSQIDRFDDSGPFKAEMLSRMEQLTRGDRVLPPCDRCRRLHMDCLKNLTACQGCTRKHAKCSWKDVSDQELIDNPRPPPKDISVGASALPAQPEGPPQPVRDEELLGEDDSDEENAVFLPKIEPSRDTPLSSKEGSLPPFPSSRIDSSPSADGPAIHRSEDEISAYARENPSNHIVEIPLSIPQASGFAPVNREHQHPEAHSKQQSPTIDASLATIKDTASHPVLTAHTESSPASTPTAGIHNENNSNSNTSEYRSKWIS